MEQNVPEVPAASGESAAPKNASSPAAPGMRRAAAQASFTASVREIVAVPLTYLAAWLYIAVLLPYGGEDPLRLRLRLAVFTLAFVALAEYLHRGAPRARESWIWLGCLSAVLLGIVLGRDRVWEDYDVLFLHVFAVWWLLSRSGTLLEGESGHLLPLDALDGFFVFPFRHFLLNLRALSYALMHPRGEGRSARRTTILWSLAALVAALALLVGAAGLLMEADAAFDRLLSSLTDRLHIDWDEGLTARLLLCLPVGAYLFGLLAGTAREDKAQLRRCAAAVSAGLKKLRQVPAQVWLALTALFCALYALFFAVQAQYLFGAFTRTLPAGFVVAEYARRGFFELCKVMAVNFALLWLVTRLAREDVRRSRALLTLCLLLLGESVLFAVVALSKLWLYISCFGFTPRRLQAAWLACTLLFGCLCAAWSLVREQKTFRLWMVFGAATLAALCLY